MANILGYCTTEVDNLSNVGQVDTLEDIQADIRGVSMILASMACDGMSVEPEQLLVCRGVLGLVADVLGGVIAVRLKSVRQSSCDVLQEARTAVLQCQPFKQASRTTPWTMRTAASLSTAQQSIRCAAIHHHGAS